MLLGIVRPLINSQFVSPDVPLTTVSSKSTQVFGSKWKGNNENIIFRNTVQNYTATVIPKKITKNLPPLEIQSKRFWCRRSCKLRDHRRCFLKQLRSNDFVKLEEGEDTLALENRVLTLPLNLVCLFLRWTIQLTTCCYFFNFIQLSQNLPLFWMMN